jgi:hypothetical protein
VVIGGIFPIFTNGASQAIWQAKVAPDVQGRVFSARRMIAWSVGPITPILAGLLADYVTEPAMQANTWLCQCLRLDGRHHGWLRHGFTIGFNWRPLYGRCSCSSHMLFVPHVRNLEAELPDHDQMQKLENSNNDRITPQLIRTHPPDACLAWIFISSGARSLPKQTPAQIFVTIIEHPKALVRTGRPQIYSGR